MMYELMLVATVDKGDQLLGRVEKLIKAGGALDLKVDRLGRKSLAYVIKKQSDANYYLVNFEATPNTVGPLTDKLRLEQEDLLRFLIVKKQKVKLGKKKIKKVSREQRVEKPKAKVTVAVKSAKRVKSTAERKKGGISSKARKAKGKSKKD